ncbi:hypothetical protein V5O48_002689 [Marasmius crinis-equi]|uniref:G domain-containing protein n=1 Tax=Marasmius crinis-equi TaxID=585013 RepID=A0ABR3FVC2_9AGAR
MFSSGTNLPVGMGLQSCTELVQIAPPFELAGYLVTLIDTPGFDDTNKSDMDILKTTAEFLAKDFKRGRRLAGVLYLHRISDPRMGGISRRNFNMFKQLCGEHTLKNVVIISNMWGQVSPELGNAREEELTTNEQFFKPALDKGAKMVRHDNTPENALAILRHLVGNEPLPLRIQTEIVDGKKDIWQTAAGDEVAPELAAQNRKFTAERDEFLQQMKGGVQAKFFSVFLSENALCLDEIDHRDDENRGKIREETGKLQAEIGRANEEGERLASEYAAEKQQLQLRAEEDRQTAEREAERQRAEIRALHQRLQDEANRTNAQREDLQRQLNDAVQHYERRGGGGCILM